MNFRNLKTNFRFIFAGIVGIGLRHYIERLFPSKILLIVILIISVLAIITGVMGIYNEFKNRKNGDTAPENNVKPQRIKTKEEKESVERKCKQFEEVFSRMENEAEDLEKKYDELEKMREELGDKYRLDTSYSNEESYFNDMEKLLFDSIMHWREDLSYEKLKKEEDYAKIEDKVLETFEKRLKEIDRRVEVLNIKSSYDNCEKALLYMEEDIKELEKNYNIEDMKELKENFEFWNDALKKEKEVKEGEYGKKDDKVLKAFEERIKEIERKIKILEAKHQEK